MSDMQDPLALAGGSCNIMIDIETLGTFYDAPVIQIGVVAFRLATLDKPNGEVGPPLTLSITLQSALEFGVVEPKTLRWWFEQDQAAIDSVILASHQMELGKALGRLSSFIGKYPGALIWACPPQFDLSILKTVYRAVTGGRQPWPHRSERCLRTLCDLVGYNRRKSPFRATIKHNAGYDALAQAQQCIAAHNEYYIQHKEPTHDGRPEAPPLEA